MADFVYFLGRFHVLLLHLPIGILLLAVVLEVAVPARAVSGIWLPSLDVVWLLGARHVRLRRSVLGLPRMRARAGSTMQRPALIGSRVRRWRL